MGSSGAAPYAADRVGTAVIDPTGEFVAGSTQSFTLTYTAGYFGIDDTGSLKIVQRFASDTGRPQFADPAAPNHVSATASNGAVLALEYDPKRNVRPWDKALVVKVVRGFLREGDRVAIRFANLRLQTFHEPSFEFKVLVDPFATYIFTELPVQPTIAIVAGKPVLYKAILPTGKRIGESFTLGFKGEDEWGNPSDRVDGTFALRASLPVDGLPATFTMRPGAYAHSVAGLSVREPGDLVIDVLDMSGQPVCRSNPLRILRDAELLPYWADLHGQSEETIGTNSARELIVFARDRAFLDAMSHQGNDFQITTPFWHALNRLTAEFNRDGSFVIFPGYEWSGNTGLGGDRNVMFMHEGQPIHRSHHGLVADLSDVASDANSAADLFAALKDEDCVVFAHIGGRYADITMAHDARIERAVEVHSDWGTFEWLLDDAFAQGYRVGVLANSDGHKGRHGASHPGASLFGAYGGLSCLLARELTRPALFEALRRRHHYATTGCRAILDTAVRFDTPAELYGDDPAMGGAVVARVDRAMMGDILRTGDAAVTFTVEVVGSAPIERIELRNRLAVLETIRPYAAEQLGSRIRIVWEGAEYRGRGRQTIWDGSAVVTGNRIERISPINLWNLDKPVTLRSPGEIAWQALTTGGFGGFDAVLAEPRAGRLRIKAGLVEAEIAIAGIGRDDLVFDTAGGIKRRLRVFRLPDRNPTVALSLERRVRLTDVTDNALYVCVTQEDGHLIWSSPIYLIR